MEDFFGRVLFGGLGCFFPCINLHKYGQGEGIIKIAECIPFHFIKQNSLKMLTRLKEKLNLTIISFLAKKKIPDQPAFVGRRKKKREQQLYLIYMCCFHLELNYRSDWLNCFSSECRKNYMCICIYLFRI